MGFTRRPTWSCHRPNLDRTILYNGERIARTYEHEFGPKGGKWETFPQWYGAPRGGIFENLQEALDAVKLDYQPTVLNSA